VETSPRAVAPGRGPGGQRQFEKADIRRLSFIMIAQSLGFSIAEIRDQLSSLPEGRTPTAADWRRLSATYRADLDRRIDQLTRLRDDLDGCIGCGCLSLDRCGLYNPRRNKISQMTREGRGIKCPKCSAKRWNTMWSSSVPAPLASARRSA
jgi:redox-sensitive transcriptional activator SoxR